MREPTPTPNPKRKSTSAPPITAGRRAGPPLEAAVWTQGPGQQHRPGKPQKLGKLISCLCPRQPGRACRQDRPGQVVGLRTSCLGRRRAPEPSWCHSLSQKTNYQLVGQLVLVGSPLSPAWCTWRGDAVETSSDRSDSQAHSQPLRRGRTDEGGWARTGRAGALPSAPFPSLLLSPRVSVTPLASHPLQEAGPRHGQRTVLSRVSWCSGYKDPVGESSADFTLGTTSNYSKENSSFWLHLHWR